MSTFKMESITKKQKYLRDHIFEELQHAIYSGKLKSGERVTEKKVAEELGVSRTPVRESLYRLSSLGLIRMIPHRGFIVNGWTQEEIKDFIELRITLEVFAARLAIQRISENEKNELKELIGKMKEAVLNKDFRKASKLNTIFHNKIVAASKNEALKEVIEPIRDKIDLFRNISISSPSRLEESFEEHKNILNAILNKDSELAQVIIKQHIEKVGLTIKEKTKEKPEKGNNKQLHT